MRNPAAASSLILDGWAYTGIGMVQRRVVAFSHEDAARGASSTGSKQRL